MSAWTPSMTAQDNAAIDVFLSFYDNVDLTDLLRLVEDVRERAWQQAGLCYGAEFEE